MNDEIAQEIGKLSSKARWKMHVQLFCQWSTLPLSLQPPNYTEWLLTRGSAELREAIEIGRLADAPAPSAS